MKWLIVSWRRASLLPIIIWTALIFSSHVSLAEQCWKTSIGCKGLIGVLRVNIYDGPPIEDYANILFGSPQLPQMDSIVEIQRSVIFRPTFDLKYDDRYLGTVHADFVQTHGRHDLDARGDSQSVHDAIGQSFMAPGTKVRILGYQFYKHLFVLVQIVDYPKKPFPIDFNKYKNARLGPG